MRVPVDWRHPAGASVGLAVVRHRASDPARRIGSLVVDPGGPGGSGLDFVEQGAADLSAGLLARFDLVSWDPRGVGQSHPVRCDSALLDHPASLFPTTEPELDVLKTYNEELRASCRADTGPLYDHLDSTSNARDLNAFRAALGEDELTFFSISYGTLIGEQYAELFPHRIRAMALDSNEDHSVGALTWVTRLSQAQEQSYGQFARWCGRTPACALYPRDAQSVLDRLYARAQEGTISVPGFPGNAITPQILIDFIRGELGGIAKWPDLAQNLLAVLNEPAVTATATAGPATVARPMSATSSPSEEAAKTAMVCEDHQWDISSLADLRTLRRAMARSAPHTHLSTTGFKDVTGCLGWPHPVADPQHTLVVRGAPSILMVNSRYDVATPYPGARRAAAQIGPSAILLTYDGTSHVDYEETDCVRSAVDRYLTDLITPAPDTHCPAVFPR
ncbi:alpha/beta hydrolase [Actinoplanes sp. NPDC051411]|uniref:alpha/beta hydrolase n=1 Tax=Actinoplanes sp. NPDC051411 TaxID=3155522 RepID=UPI0034244DD3